MGVGHEDGRVGGGGVGRGDVVGRILEDEGRSGSHHSVGAAAVGVGVAGGGLAFGKEVVAEGGADAGGDDGGGGQLGGVVG